MRLDSYLLELFNRSLSCLPLDLAMVALTLALPLLLLVPVVWWLRGQRREARALLGVMLAALVLATIAQLVTGRPRPAGVRLLLDPPPFFAFPSGHAAIAAAFASFVALLRPERTRAVVVLALGIALSRVYLGHHWPSDVLAGALIGAACGSTVYGFAFAPAASRPRWAWLLWPQLALCCVAALGATIGLTQFRVLLIPGADKALHFVLFGLLAGLVVAWCSKHHPVRVLAWLALFATVDEVAQAFLPQRTFDPLDLAFTLAGMLSFGALAAVLRGGPHFAGVSSKSAAVLVVSGSMAQPGASTTYSESDEST